MANKLLLSEWANGGVLVRRGGGTPPPPPPTSRWTATNPPGVLKPGESYFDNIPAGVPTYLASSITTSTDWGTLNAAAESVMSSPGYIILDVTPTYFINLLKLIGSNAWYGYANSTRKVMGWISGFNTYVTVQEAAGMIPSDARAYALAPSNTGSPVPLYNIYMSNSSSTIPIFISGISFDGVFQGPYGVPASSGLSVNTGVASPIAHRGLAVVRGITGSRIQFCRFRGFAFGIKAAPPYELSGLETDNSAGLTIYRCEVDGREVSTGAVSAGGYMDNYNGTLTVQDSWLHDTRRSGFAIHEHTGAGDNGNYTIKNFQVENIAIASDGFAGSGLGFNASNVEEVSGTMVYTNCSFALDRGYHIALGTTNGGAIAKSITVTDFTSLSTTYNGCLVIRIIGTPNGAGTSPYETLYQSGGFAALPIHVTKNGFSCAPVASTSFNAAIHTPDKYYIVVTN